MERVLLNRIRALGRSLMAERLFQRLAGDRRQARSPEASPAAPARSG